MKRYGHEIHSEPINHRENAGVRADASEYITSFEKRTTISNPGFRTKRNPSPSLSLFTFISSHSYPSSRPSWPSSMAEAAQ